MKEGPSRGTILVLVAAGLIVVLVLLWRYFAASAEESDSARWLAWDILTTPGQLKEFLDNKDMEGHMQVRLARIEEARRALNDGLRDLGGSGTRKDALTEIKRAAELYAGLINECSDKPLLHQQVLIGAAKAHESLGEIDEARKYYQQLSQKYGDTVLGKEATQQLARLDEAEQNGDLKALRDEYSRPATP
jgi:hypothetical protein